METSDTGPLLETTISTTDLLRETAISTTDHHTETAISLTDPLMQKFYTWKWRKIMVESHSVLVFQVIIMKKFKRDGDTFTKTDDDLNT